MTHEHAMFFNSLMNHQHSMLFNNFWIVPLVVMSFCLSVLFMKRYLKFKKLPSQIQNHEPYKPTEEISDEVWKAGQNALENLDWEIRFLEKQIGDTNDPKEREKAELELKRKREEYHNVVERLK